MSIVVTVRDDSVTEGMKRYAREKGDRLSRFFAGLQKVEIVLGTFARLNGLEVRYHYPNGLTLWEAETLFNAYLARLLARENVPAGAFRFDRDEDDALYLRLWFRRMGRSSSGSRRAEPPEPLLGSAESGYYPGMIVIERPVDQ